jgi:hypothetical protein
MILKNRILKLKAKLLNEGVLLFTDEEIEKALKRTTTPKANIKRAKLYRDLGYFN